MKTSVEKITPTHAKLTLSISPEELKPYIDQAYKSIAKQVQVPGVTTFLPFPSSLPSFS